MILRGNDEDVQCYRYRGTIHDLILWSPSLTFDTSARSPDSTFGTNTVAMHTELNPMVLHLWTTFDAPRSTPGYRCTPGYRVV